MRGPKEKREGKEGRGVSLPIPDKEKDIVID